MRSVNRPFLFCCILLQIQQNTVIVKEIHAIATKEVKR